MDNKKPVSIAQAIPPIPWTRKNNRLYTADGEEIVVATNASPRYRKVSNETAEAIRVSVNSHDALVAAAKAAIAYDEAIHSCTDDPEKMASFCTAQGDDLDSLYADWIEKSNAALKLAEPTIWHSLGRPCGALANEAEGITEIPEHVNCPVCLARIVESEDT